MKNLPIYLLIAALSVALILSVRGCVRKEVQEHIIIQAATVAPDSGHMWRDALYREHRRAEAAEADRKTMLLAYGQLVDSVARLNKVKTKQIDQITWLSAELRGVRTIAVVNQHGAGGTAVSFNYSDAWLELRGQGDIYHDSLSALRLEYLVRDSLIITTIRKPVSLFRKATFVDVTSANPEMHITGVRTLQVRDRKKPWGIGLQVGTTYTGITWAPYMGLGLSYNLIRF